MPATSNDKNQLFISTSISSAAPSRFEIDCHSHTEILKQTCMAFEILGWEMLNVQLFVSYSSKKTLYSFLFLYYFYAQEKVRKCETCSDLQTRDTQI